jgi:OOP family OmpA-OmpF porin
MSMKRYFCQIKGLSLLVLLTTFSHAGMAADSSFYIGAGTGASSVSVSGFDDSTPVKIFGGFNFNSYFGVELGYVDFGKYQANGGSNSVDAMQMALVGYLPLGKDFSFMGKVGFYSWNIEASPCFFNCTGSGDSGYASLGIQYMFIKNFGMRAEYEFYSDAGGADLSAVTASLLGRF